MTNDLNRTAKALQFAIRMEIDGKEYYLEISRQSRSEVGKKLMASLAAAEDVHRQKFESIFEAIRVKQSWPPISLPAAKGIKTIFAEALAHAKPETVNTATEMAAVEKAIGMEIASYDYYVNQSKKATLNLEKKFYEAVAAEEHIHHLTLLDYKEFLDDPAAWFVKTEHPSFD